MSGRTGKAPAGGASVADRLRAAELSARQAECLAMRCFDGMTYRQIARECRTSLSAVGTHICRARAKLAAVGLRAEILEMKETPLVIIMPPHKLDQLGLDHIRGRW